MMIKLALFRCSCGQSFEAPLLPDFSYGEFLMWSASGAVVYLNALEDECYGEVRTLIEKVLPQISPQKIASKTQAIFGEVACDRDEAGQHYRIDQSPRCPDDGSLPNSWEFIVPNKYRAVEKVTHFIWNDLAVEQKEYRVIKALGLR